MNVQIAEEILALGSTELSDSKISHIVPMAKSRFDDVHESLIDLHLDRNHRDELVFEPDHPDMVALIEGLRIEGYRPGKRVVLHDEGNGRFDGLCGNRRVTACRIAGIKKIPAEILSGLTPDEKMSIILDQGQEADPGEIGRFKQVRALTRLGLSRLAVAQRLGWRTKRGKGGWDTSRVQHYDELARLPKHIQDQWVLQQRNPKDKAITLPTLSSVEVRSLFEAQGKDKKAGHIIKQGPELTAEVEKLRKDGATSKTARTKKAITGTGLSKLADSIDNEVLKRFLLGLAGDQGVDDRNLLLTINTSLNITNPNPAEETTVNDLFTTEETPVEDLFTTEETPVVETPVVETPVVETPVVETPVVETPVHSGRNRRK